MSNWCVGTLKVRGVRADLEKFVLEVLKPISQGDLSMDKYGRVASDKRCWIFYSLKNGCYKSKSSEYKSRHLIFRL